MLTDMGKWTRARVRMEHEGISKRELCRQEEISDKTLPQILTYAAPPGHRKRGGASEAEDRSVRGPDLPDPG